MYTQHILGKRITKTSPNKVYTKYQKENRIVKLIKWGGSRELTILRNKKGQIIKRLGTKEKILLARGLKNNNINFPENKLVIEINATVKTYKAAVPLLRDINLSGLFRVQNGKNFKCKIIKGNLASVNCNKDGYRYFSKNNSITEEKEIIPLDIIDLYEIIHNVSYYKALAELCKLFKIKVEEGEWIMNQKIKYVDNLAEIENAKEEMRLRYPSLYKYIKKHLYLLTKMNLVAIKSLCTSKESVSNSSIFFVSSRFLEEDFAEQDITKSHSLLSILINMFCCLGLIEKIPFSKIPQSFKNKATTQKEEKRSLVSFYTIPEYTTAILTEAEKRVIKLNKAKISATMINVKNTEKVLGKRIYKKVFEDEAIRLKSLESQKKVIGGEMFDYNSYSEKFDL